MAISLIFERRVLFVPKYEGDEEDFYDNTEQAILISVVCNNSNECIIDINKTNNNNIIIFSLLTWKVVNTNPNPMFYMPTCDVAGGSDNEFG